MFPHFTEACWKMGTSHFYPSCTAFPPPSAPHALASSPVPLYSCRRPNLTAPNQLPSTYCWTAAISKAAKIVGEAGHGMEHPFSEGGAHSMHSTLSPAARELIDRLGVLAMTHMHELDSRGLANTAWCVKENVAYSYAFRESQAALLICVFPPQPSPVFVPLSTWYVPLFFTQCSHASKAHHHWQAYTLLSVCHPA